MQFNTFRAATTGTASWQLYAMYLSDATICWQAPDPAHCSARAPLDRGRPARPACAAAQLLPSRLACLLSMCAATLAPARNHEIADVQVRVRCSWVKSHEIQLLIPSSLAAGHAHCCTCGLRMSHRCGNNAGCAASEVVGQTDNNGRSRLSIGIDAMPQASKRVLFAGDGLLHTQHMIPIWRRLQVTCCAVIRR